MHARGTVVVCSAVMICGCVKLLRGTYSFILWLSVLCIHAKAWFAAPVLCTHAEVTKNMLFLIISKVRYPKVLDAHAAKQGEACELAAII